MASSYNTITVTTAATQILPANLERRGCLIANTSNQTVYIGMDASVTTSNGLPIAANSTFSNSGPNEVWKGSIYGIVAGTTADCRFWEWVQ